jgi:hypothetical protein
MSPKLDSKSWTGSKNLKKLNQKYKIGSKSSLKYTKFLDQAQNTSLDSVTAYKSKQQLKSNLKSRYEYKSWFKVMNLIKKPKKLSKKSKIGSKSIQNPSIPKYLRHRWCGSGNDETIERMRGVNLKTLQRSKTRITTKMCIQS